ncbi:hypothetical protein LJC17_01375 [Acholeplasma sp. OttesenSCG-928-E16]|nr:hypothetical protein [Acholeplasma sp. OttesenSCG-928-E16]
MFTSLKKKIVLRGMEKRKKENPFDINYADNYKLSEDATSDINNSHYFCIQSFETKEVLFYRSAKRGSDGVDEVWLVYRDLNGDIYMAEKDHYQKNEKNPTTINCLEPGKKMEFIYKGFVKKAKLTDKGYVVDEESLKIPFQLNGIFYGTSKIFEFTQHMDSNVTASAIAKEKLSRKIQDAFNEIYQVHYEQGGKADLNIKIGNKKDIMKGYPAIRDHSYGKRNWDFFDRYVWSIIMLENGDFVHTSFMRYPVLTELQAGFYLNDEMISVKKSNKMDSMPIIGTTPNEFSMDVEYGNGTKKHIIGKLDFVCPFYFEGDFNVNEGVCEYIVDGIKGKGIGEFAFNKDQKRWTR